MAEKKLTKYRAMRDFTKTAEPSGERKVAQSPHARFVVQKHAATRLHYDFRLELDGVFHSWAVTRGPSLNPNDKRLAVEVEEHPLDYGDFEGTIPKGQYGGGTVMLWDRGYWAPEDGSRTPEEQIKKGEIKFVVAGKKLNGSYVLVRMKPRPTDKLGVNNWLLIKHRDEYATDADVLKQDKSVASGRDMDAIKEGRGKRPTPFILAAKETFKSDAVWQSKPRGAPRNEKPEPEPAAKKAAAKKPAAKKSLKAETATSTRAKSRATMPEFIEPQFSRSVTAAPNGANWAHEVKFDGYRMQLRVENGKAELRTRKGLDWSGKFGAIVRAGRTLPDCMIDGEVCALDKKGTPSFPALQAALSEGKTDDLVYFTFDMMFAEGSDLRARPLSERKERLAALLEDAGEALLIRYVEHLTARGDDVWKAACQADIEGIISKPLNAPYRSGDRSTWTKAKCRNGQEIVIGGWTETDGRFRSLLAGVYRDDEFIYVGRVGTGYNSRNLPELSEKLKALKRDARPFVGANAPRKERGMFWVEPELVAQVEFAGWSEDGILRQSAYKGLRADKPAREVTVEMPADAETELAAPKPKTSAKAPVRGVVRSTGSERSEDVRGVAISKPDKALWPDASDGKPVTKLDLAEYLEAVGPWIIGYIKGRPCSIVRAPDGIEGKQRFFQRHGSKGQSELLSLVDVRGDKEPYLQIDSIEGLIAAGQSAALEFHPWNCRPDDVEVPGRLVFDLDPSEDLGFDAVIAAAKEIRDRLDALGLPSFCKTTGGKGLHVVTPLAKERNPLDWKAAKGFAYGVCAQMAEDSPDKYLVNMSKAKRTGRIFLDYLRNDRSSTAVALLSPRARPGATVSMPISWKQVKAGLEPKKFTMRTAPALMRKNDPWDGYEKAAGALKPAARKLIG